MKKLLILLTIGIGLVSCSTLKKDTAKNQIQLNGKIQRLGMSTFQYGTHTLTSDHKTYALKSNKVDLDSYTDKEVTLTGSKIEGYPIENGPDFINVTKITLK